LAGWATFKLPSLCRRQLNWRDVDVWEPHTDDHFLAFVPTSRDERQRLALTRSGAFLFAETNRKYSTMDDDSKIDLHAGANYALKSETHTILGGAFDVLNEHGHGLNEKCYENSLVVEFKL